MYYDSNKSDIKTQNCEKLTLQAYVWNKHWINLLGINSTLKYLVSALQKCWRNFQGPYLKEQEIYSTNCITIKYKRKVIKRLCIQKTSGQKKR